VLQKARIRNGEISIWLTVHTAILLKKNNVYKPHSNNIHQQYNSDSLKLWDRFYKIYITKNLAGENKY